MPGFVIGLLLAAAASTASGPKLLNVQELVTADDYPLISLRNEEQGSVTVKVHVDETGLVTSCTVTQSSGHSALDAQTCALFRSRARFEPGHNRRGKASSGDYSQKITWTLQGETPRTPLPRQAWTTRTTIAMSKNERLLDCKMEATGFAKPPPDCDILMAVARARELSDDPGAAVAGFAISEVHFYPVDPAKAPTPPKLADATQVAQQVTRVVIEPDGRMSACEGMRYTGVASPDHDACQFLKGQMFEPATGGKAPLVGTIVIRVYARVQSIS